MNDQKDDDQLIGYGRPPEQSKFKPGQSGNPNGRPPMVFKHDELIIGIPNEAVLGKSFYAP